MNTGDDLRRDQVRRLLGDEALQELVEKLDRRMAKNADARGHVILRDAAPRAREAVTALLGLPPKPTGPLRVDLQRLDGAIRDSGAAEGLVEALTILLGRPPQHPAIERQKAKELWQFAWQALLEEEQGLPEGVRQHLQQICQDGALRRASGGSIEQAQAMLRGLARCLRALPCDPPTPLPIFAARVLGDSHALDADRPLNSLLVQAIVKTNELAPVSGQARDVWSSVNVVQDELSSTVLVLNLPVQEEGLLGRTLRAHAATGEPCRLTFAQLRRHRLVLEAKDTDIFVCENPSILAAAAEQLAAGARPLVCVEGQPSHASLRLLAACCASGARLRYHGDIDRAGLQIAAQILDRFDAKPWRLSASDYAQHVQHSELPWQGPVPETCWDAELADAIRTYEKILLEETVVADLLKDLSDR